MVLLLLKRGMKRNKWREPEKSFFWMFCIWDNGAFGNGFIPIFAALLKRESAGRNSFAMV